MKPEYPFYEVDKAFDDTAKPASNNNEWSTPSDLLSNLHEKFDFTLDPCCSDKIAHEHGYEVYGQYRDLRHLTKEQDGLSESWKWERVFMNPPYNRGELAKWTAKAKFENTENNVFIVGLLPASTDTGWWHENVEGHAHVVHLKGRKKFGGAKGSARFPSVLVYWL